MFTSRLPGSVDFVVGSREAPQKGANVAGVQDLNLECALEQAWGVVFDEEDVDAGDLTVDCGDTLSCVSDSYESWVSWLLGWDIVARQFGLGRNQVPSLRDVLSAFAASELVRKLGASFHGVHLVSSEDP